MPRMKKTMKAADAPGKDLPKIPVELIDHFVTDPMSAEAVMAASQVRIPPIADTHSKLIADSVPWDRGHRQ